MAEKKKKKWIAGAIKRKGALTKKAKKAKMSPMAYAKKKEHAKGLTGQQARMAIVLKGLSKKKKR